MAKGIGLIGNFRGKVGNMVGYNLKDSNNKQTQGVRVYQPIVKNPKTYAQAEQRAKLAPINATYRVLKMIIDRGQEGKAYGNKSRLAWLSDAMKSFRGPWMDKGSVNNHPAIGVLTRGTLLPLTFDEDANNMVSIEVRIAGGTAVTTVGELSTLLLAIHPQLKEGDQITGVGVQSFAVGMNAIVESIVIDTTSTEQLANPLGTDDLFFNLCAGHGYYEAIACIVSREATNGEHLRSTSTLIKTDRFPSEKLEDAAKEAAIKSYMAGGSNTDWAEESLQG